MSTLTKEWLHQTIAELEEERDATPGAVNEDAARALEAMKIALASLEADVVAWTDEQELRDVEKYGCGYLFTANPVTPNADPHRVIKLYAAPPAPVSVPDVVSWEDVPEEITEYDIALASAWAHGFNQCRAAMLQGAEQQNRQQNIPENIPTLRDGLEAIGSLGEIDAGKIQAERDSINSPVIPDGWVIVPVEPTDEMWRAALDATGIIDSYKAMIAAAQQQEA
ncbi:TPA: hypothetical protein N5L19_002795 [Enterobacter hormaechei subsp. xiangfangensis]|nr:hypothetical protein [Enterobacter hormaechei subsp. xiangfangensis]HCM9208095.1 hypothetical protein [Enterobacter hormaechei subsp. xiangfangensis]